MKKVFLDTNVLLDFVLGREGMKDALAILQLQEDNKVYLLTSILSMANVAYVAKKGRTKEELYELMQGLSEMIHTLQMDEIQLQEALSVIAPDFEDMLQMICSKTHDCDAIITRNKKDFTLSETPVYTPDEFLHIPYYWSEDSGTMMANEPMVEYHTNLVFGTPNT